MQVKLLKTCRSNLVRKVVRTELIESADYSSEEIFDEIQEAESEQVVERVTDLL